jgi:hypothetical protein
LTLEPRPPRLHRTDYGDRQIQSGYGPVILDGRHYGDVILRGWWGGEVEIVRADPLTLISDVLLDEIRAGTTSEGIELEGDVLRIRATNRTVIYRIVEHRPDLRAHVLEWPD